MWGGDALYVRGGGKGLEEGGEEGGRLIVGDDVGDGVAVGSEDGEGGAESADIGGSRAGGLGLRVHVPLVRGNEDVLVTASGRHWEAAREVGGQPLGASD